MYTSGVFGQTVDFDPGDGTFEITSNGFQDAFLMRLGPLGEFQWAKSWGGGGSMLLGDMKSSADGSLYLAGSFSGSVEYDAGGETLRRSSAGSNDIYLHVVDRDGNLKWAESLGSEEDETGLGIAVAPDGGAHLAGMFSGTLDFDPRAGVYELHNHYAEDLYLTRFAPPEAPTAIQLVDDRIVEGQPAGSVVGVLAAVDADSEADLSFRLVSGTGDVDNGSFRIEQGLLSATEVFDHSVKNSYSVRVRATDPSGLWYEQPLTINVLPTSQAASIGNRVWLDANENGLQDSGEVGVEGAYVEVISTDDAIVRGHAVTDADGLYTVGGLLPGMNYHAVIRPPTGYGFTTMDAGPDATDSDADAGGATGSFAVAAGEVIDSLDAGLTGGQPYFGFASISNGPATDRGRAIAADSEGNVYVTGTFSNTVDFDPGPATLELTSNGSSDIFVAKFTSRGALVWAKSMGGTSFDEGHSVTVTADGGVLVTGSFQSAVDFDPGPNQHLLSSKGSTDAFIAKLDASGHLLWAHQAGSTSSDYGYGVAAAPDGSAYVIGYFRNTVDFDPGDETFNLTSSNHDAFVWKLDALGGFVWAARLGGSGSDVGYAVAVTPSGNVVAAGSFQGTADMDPGPGTSNLTSAGGSDAFFSVLDPSGAFVWAGRMGGADADYPYAVAAGSDGSLYTAGYFDGSSDFDPGAGSFVLNSAGGRDGFVAKLDAAGNFVWASALGGPNNDFAEGLAIAPDDGVFVTGSFAEVADFDPGPGVLERHAAEYVDAYVTKLDPAGGLEWVQTFGGINSDTGWGVVAAADGSVLTTGKVQGPVDFDSRGGEYIVSGGSGDNFFLSRHVPARPPTAISLTQHRVFEQQPVGTNVGRLTADDPEPGETFTFELVAGTGDDDNAAFEVEAGILRTLAVFDHGVKQSYTIRVRATDSAGLSFEQPVAISIENLTQAGSIGDRVWHDQNGNGIQDAGEPGVASVAVEAISSTDGVSRGSAITDSSGLFTIAGLLPDSDYELQFRSPVGFDFTLVDSGGDDTSDSDADDSGRTSPVTLSAGSALVDVDAGLVGAAPWFGFAVAAGEISESNLDDQGQSVVTDADGNVYLAGLFEGTVDFDPGPGTYELSSQGATDTVVAKYSPGGALLWATSFGGTNYVHGTSVAVAPGGDLLVAGEFTETATFRAGKGKTTHTAAGGFDSFLVRIDAAGELVWAKTFGGSENDRIYGGRRGGATAAS